jgi:hypothetical protein
MRRSLSAVVLCVCLTGVWGCSLPWQANKGVKAADLNPLAGGTRNALFTASKGSASTDGIPKEVQTKNQSGW